MIPHSFIALIGGTACTVASGTEEERLQQLLKRLLSKESSVEGRNIKQLVCASHTRSVL